MSDLDVLFSSDEVEEAPEVVETPEKVEEVPVEESANTEAAEEVAEVKEAPTAPKESAEVEQAWTKSMALDERKKRQDIQKELDDYKAQMAEKAQVDAPDVFEDQDAFREHLRAENQAGLLSQKIEMSRMFAMGQHDDYEEKEQAFMELAESTPGLADQVRQHANPAAFVYEQGQKSMEFKQMQDVGSMKDKMRAEIRAELEAEMSSTTEKKAAIGSNITPSLANARSSNEGVEPPADLDSIYKT